MPGAAESGDPYSADCGTALREHAQARQGVLDALDAVGELLDITAELLAEGQRRSVL